MIGHHHEAVTICLTGYKTFLESLHHDESRPFWLEKASALISRKGDEVKLARVVNNLARIH